MPIDYRRLVDGLSLAAEKADGGGAGVAAVGILVETLRAATGAAGATFTEYGEDGARVVVAKGVMAWALGQPIDPEFVDSDQPARPWAAQVDLMPVQVAEPLLGRGVLAIAGHPVRVGQSAVGAVHLYFGEVDAEMFAEAEPALRVVAAAVAHVYGDPDVPPTFANAGDDDRTLFLAVAGHELRTPVTVVKGYATMLADRWDSLDESNRRDAARVLTQRADELARLVDRLLGASVGEGGPGWPVRNVPFDVIEALLRAAGDLPAEHRRLLRLELPNSLPPASGDPAILASILAELVTNAVRYTPPAASSQRAVASGAGAPDTGAPDTGVPEASVEIQAGADAQTVVISVCDRGVGIDPAHVERAFERFWRARRDGDGHGVGLGLYLVRRLVERQNGWVSLRPRDGGGTVAEVRLPRADTILRPPAAEPG